MALAIPRLYGVTDTRLMPGPILSHKIAAALAGGCGWIQYRDKTQDHARRRNEARLLLDLCEEYNAKLIINDDVALAAATGAHGVHLGQDDMDAATARRQLGDGAIIGVTCHAQVALAVAAAQAGADYVAFGRFFNSATKPDASLASLDILARARQAVNLPIIAIGGIDLGNATSVLLAGADTLAVCGALFDTPDPGEQARRFCQLAHC